jgi:hypothetical protein
MRKKLKTSKADCAVIRRIVRRNVEQTLSDLDPFIAQSRWLAKTNRYSTNTIGRLKLDAKPGASFRGGHLAQYISASSVLHCADGWSYLGRAINCLLNGDPHRVIHLAYYAELRAALSLLACEGIGVFNNNHFVIDGSGSARALPSKRPTHEAAWSYLNYWGTLKRSGDLFSQVITPAGIALSDWFEPLGGVRQVIRPRAREWFGQWSMDLALFADDRDARNESSYRPDGIPTPWYLSATEALTLATEIWEVCEPSANSLFDGIDRHILRMTVESAFKGTHNATPSQDAGRFATLVASVVDPLSLDPPVATEWKSFLKRETAPGDPRIFLYSSKNPIDRAVGHAAVMTRAALLLRLATGSVLRLIRSAGVSGDKLEFWWGQLGINRGLWDGAKSRTDLLDLWDDIASLFDDIRAFKANTPPAEQTFQLIGNKIPQVILGLGGCERVAIWSLTP